MLDPMAILWIVIEAACVFVPAAVFTLVLRRQ